MPGRRGPSSVPTDRGSFRVTDAGWGRGRRLGRRALSRRAVRRCGPRDPRPPRPGAPRRRPRATRPPRCPTRKPNPMRPFPGRTHRPPAGSPPTTGTATTPRHEESARTGTPLPPSTAPIASALDREGLRPGRPASVVVRTSPFSHRTWACCAVRAARSSTRMDGPQGRAQVVLGGVHGLRVVGDAHWPPPPTGWFQVRPASSVFHSRRSQPSSPPVTKPSVAELGRARSTRPGASWRDQEPPSSSVTHTAPGFARPGLHDPRDRGPDGRDDPLDGDGLQGRGRPGGRRGRRADVTAGAVAAGPGSSVGVPRKAHAMRTASAARSAHSPTTGATLRSSIGTACQTPTHCTRPRPTKSPDRCMAPPRGLRQTPPEASSGPPAPEGPICVCSPAGGRRGATSVGCRDPQVVEPGKVPHAHRPLPAARLDGRLGRRRCHHLVRGRSRGHVDAVPVRGRARVRPQHLPRRRLHRAGAPGLGLVIGPYTRDIQRGSFEEVRSLAVTAGVVTLALFAATVWLELASPASSILVPGTMPLVATLVAYSVQLYAAPLPHAPPAARRARGRARPRSSSSAPGPRPALVRNLVRTRPRPTARWRCSTTTGPSDARFEGLRVRGTRATCPRSPGRPVPSTSSSPSPAPPADPARAARHSRGGRSDPFVVPPLSQVIGRGLTARHPRHRPRRPPRTPPVTLDESAIARQLTQRVVLVTGAGGSIGSELCRQIARFNPARLVLLDRDESALHGIQLDLGEGPAAERQHRPRRHPGPRHAASPLRRAPARRRLPRGRAQAPPPPRALPPRGMAEQRARHAERPDGGRGGRRRDVRQHLDRQGRRPDLGARLQQAGRRAAHRGLRRPRHRALHQRPLRQRARLAGLRRARVHGPDPARRTGDDHPPRGRALLHAHPGGLPGSSCRRPRWAPPARCSSSTWASRSRSSSSPARSSPWQSGRTSTSRSPACDRVRSSPRTCSAAVTTTGPRATTSSWRPTCRRWGPVPCGRRRPVRRSTSDSSTWPRPRAPSRHCRRRPRVPRVSPARQPHRPDPLDLRLVTP